MSEDVINKLIERVKEYITKHKLSTFQFIFHGGEPLLAPKEWYDLFTKKATEELAGITLVYSLQTNGVLYDKEWAIHLNKLGISVGFSWDGPKDVHDKFRTYHNNKGSFNDVLKGMKAHRDHIGKVGGLSVINGETSPEIYYNNIKEMKISAVSMLLPYYHYSMKDEFHKFNYKVGSAYFGKWLVSLFDIWWNDKENNKPQILFFNDLIGMILGFKLTSESFGDQEGNVLVIETNGDIETSAALKSVGNGYTKEGNNLFNSTIEDVVLDSELIQLALHSHSKLCDTCLQCPIVNICGGGRINQRYSNETGFDNPSIYCEDIKMLIAHIQNVLFDLLDQKQLKEIGLTKLEYGTF